MTIELNPAQELVATTLRGKVLVSAGAGTGKTRALTERFVRAVIPARPGAASEAHVDGILAITFTEKAAGEIAERIRAELKGAGHRDRAELLEGAWISTIHGFGRRLLRRHALEAGLDPSFTVADDVVEGFLSDEALDRALGSALRRYSTELSLVDLYGAEVVGKMVRRVARTLRSRGLDAGALVFEPTDEPDTLYREAIEVLDRASRELSPYVDDNKGAAENHEACAAARVSLEALKTGRESVQATALAIWRAVSVSWPRPARAKVVYESAAALGAAREDLARRSAALIVRPLLSQLKTVVEEYLELREELKRERGILDFDDLQLRTLELLRSEEGLRQYYRRGFSLVMVDEFQDTDEVQLGLVEAVSGDNLCTVGDERQSIYAFRGADVEVFRRHREQMMSAGAIRVDLVENYRSHHDIIAFVNCLFGAPELFGPDLPPLEASRPAEKPQGGSEAPPRVRVGIVRADKEKRAETDRAEADAVAEQFAHLRDEGYAAGDMVVLVRTYKSATPLAEALQHRGFDVEVVGGSRFFGLREIAVLRAVCAAIENPLDDTALARLLISDMSAVSDGGALLLAAARATEGGPRTLWGALESADELLDGADATAAIRLREVLVAARERAAAGSLLDAVRGAFEDSGLDLLYASAGREGEQAFENVQKFFRKIEAFERSGESGAAAFTARLEAEERFGSTESPALVVSHDSSAVRIMSVHASKGLEFPVVALPYCAEGPRSPSGPVRVAASNASVEVALKMPKEFACDGKKGYDSPAWFSGLHERARESETAEMKRQFYVACTRAREVLILSGTVKGGKTPEEMGDSPLAWCRRAVAALRSDPDGDREVREFAPGHLLAVTATAVDVLAGDAASGPPEGKPAPEATVRAVGEQECGEERVHRVRRSVSDGVSPIPPERLSATDIALHGRCSLRYWAERVVGFGDIGQGAGTGDPLAFGSALHALLQLDDGTATGLSPERVRSVARYHHLEESELPRLTAVLTQWRSSSIRSELHAHERVWTEYPFALRVQKKDGGWFDLIGAIDAWGRSGSRALVVDYKTGTTGATVAELRQRYASQAHVYAYSALREGCAHVSVRFVRLEVTGEDGAMQEVDFVFAPSDAARIEFDLTNAHRRIAEEPYRPLAAWDRATCGSCRIAGGVCPLRPLRRGSG